MDKPNIIIVLADDMGYGDSSAYGGWIDTPAMELMAREGLKFTDFHASGVVCSPTRAGLLTGRYQQRAGVPNVINADPNHADHYLGLHPSERTFPKLLKEAGYTSAIFGKWHLGYDKKFNPMHHGFDRFRGYVSGNIDYISHYDRMEIYDWWEGLEHVEEEGYTTHLITQHSVQFIKDHKDVPFCLYVAHEAVHTPLQGPEDPAIRGPKKENFHPDDPAATYCEMMKAMDDSLGEIMGAVRDAGIAENTLVFFFSDNGGHAPKSRVQRAFARAQGHGLGRRASGAGHCVVAWHHRAQPRCGRTRHQSGSLSHHVRHGRRLCARRSL